MKRLSPPSFMRAADCRIKTRKYGSTRLSVVADTARADQPVMYSLDGDGWEHTPFQTATIHHNILEALPLVWKWLGTVAG